NGYIGKIREADGGVLFLDEIGDFTRHADDAEERGACAVGR
ncbi:hypothetical protein FK521_30275, partial [Klebsiella pneumoniae]|nr:hypothetical protein [Klebsiella pneumoniae]